MQGFKTPGLGSEADPPHGSTSGRAIDTLFLPFTTGGIGGSHISGTLLGAGQRNKFGVRVIVSAPRGAQVLGMAEELGLETLPLDDPARSRHPPLYDLARVPARARLLRTLGPRLLVHTNDVAALQAWGIPARLAGRPVVHHNRAFDRASWGTRAVFGVANHVICISRACERRLDFLPPARRTVLMDDFTTPLAMDAGVARAGLLAELGAPADAPLVGFVGNFWKRKRPDFFLEAAGLIASQRHDARFVLFGRDGDIAEADLARQVAVAGLTDRVLFANFRLPPEPNLAALDVLLMPALDEPLGRTLVEALLLGVPYVAADSAGHGEIHERWGGGLMVPAEAPATAYADATLALLAAERAAALPLTRRREIGDTLRPEQQAGRVMEVYAKVS